MATALVIGNMVGSGIFLLPAALASTAGPVSILAFLWVRWVKSRLENQGGNHMIGIENPNVRTVLEGG